MSLPKKFLVDTNVPKTANRALDPNEIPPELASCVLACVDAIEHVVKKGGLVIDANGEIFAEYQQQLSMKGQPGMGDRFLKWVHDNQWNLPDSDRVSITRNGETYDQFPTHDGLNNFDNSDRKFVATSYTHPGKPPILQATDSKWWGWKEPLKEVGITVQFLCQEYVRVKFLEKMGK